MKSKKQIWVIWSSDAIGEKISPVMITTSITKLKSFLIKKIKSGAALYDSAVYSTTKQIENFKFDFKNHHRDIINSNLSYFQYEYYYDGEEI